MNFLYPLAHIIFIKLFDFWVSALYMYLYIFQILCFALYGDGICLYTRNCNGNGDENYLSGKDMICSHYSNVGIGGDIVENF